MSADDQQLIDNVMDWFDFSSMAKMLQAVDFGWVADCEEFSESILREFVRDKILDAHGRFVQSGREYGFCETGGIRVRWTGEGGTHLVVEAALVEWAASSA